MNYVTGSTVIVSVFKVLKVGSVVEKLPTKKEYKYTIKSEDGKVHENVYVDDKNAESFINSSLTKSFTKSKESGKEEV